MKKQIVCSILVAVSTMLFGQNTQLNFISSSPMAIFQVEKIYIEPSSSFSSSVEMTFSSMKPLNISPFSINAPNGVYVFNIGGFEEFNKTFIVTADGLEKNIRIRGNFQKAKEMNVWAIGSGLIFALSFDAMIGLMQIVPENYKYYSTLLPIIAGSGFGYCFISWIINIPKVEVVNKK